MTEYKLHFLRANNHIKTVEVDESTFEDQGLGSDDIDSTENYTEFVGRFDPVKHADLEVDTYSLMEAAYRESPRLLTSAIPDEKLDRVYSDLIKEQEDVSPEEAFKSAENLDEMVAERLEPSELGELNRDKFVERLQVAYETV